MNNKTIFGLRLVLGSLFILSALSKLFPIEAVDLFLVNQGIANWTFAPYLSRLFITVEFFLGISFFITPFVKRISIPFSFLLLVVFSIHLMILIVTGNGSKNCGCFGELIQMSSLEALIKNIVLILLLYLLNKYFNYEKSLSYASGFAVFSLVFACVFLIFNVKPYNIPPKDKLQSTQTDSPNALLTEENPLRETLVQPKKDSLKYQPENQINEIKSTTKKTVSVFASFKEFNNNQLVNLDNGLKLVCLFSLDCEDCMQTAFKIGQAKKDWDIFPPTYILFLGQEDQVNNFFDAAATTLPYKIISAQTFFPLIKNYPPRVVLLNNGNITSDWDYENFNLEDLKKTIMK